MSAALATLAMVPSMTAGAANSPSGFNRLETFTFDLTQNRISFTTLQQVEPRAQLLLNPARIVIDLPGTIYTNKTVRRAIGGAVREVRVGQSEPETTRLVVEFNPELPIDLNNLRLQAKSMRDWSISLPEQVATSRVYTALFGWPLNGTLTAGFGWRTHPITGQRKLHKGIDIAAPIGAPIMAAADGVVLDADFDSDYGNFVELSHSDGNTTLYAHANRLLVTKGMRVRKGQPIAEVGTTGRSTGPHLHFEVLANGKEPVDPISTVLPKQFVLFDLATL
ncbi:MAG: peptidoglycan DD-metalloendopeptidase family protein [Pseudanabaenaceae cyanobacterium bins.68]|nr:peptidoglycan DD-metalloendopeptidase family protein [Pseudanabaenaceae cyanobacterium bins.68]